MTDHYTGSNDNLILKSKFAARQLNSQDKRAGHQFRSQSSEKIHPGDQMPSIVHSNVHNLPNYQDKLDKYNIQTAEFQQNSKPNMIDEEFSPYLPLRQRSDSKQRNQPNREIAHRSNSGPSGRTPVNPLRSILKSSQKKIPTTQDIMKFNDETLDGYTEYFSQGCDFSGQLGHGQDPQVHDRSRHVNVPKSLSFDILIKQVSCGAAHTLILSKNGDLFSIGSNQFGQLGLCDRQLEFTTAPLLIQEVQTMSLQVQQIEAGATHNLLLTKSGQIFSWGSNQKGECGQRRESYDQIYSPQRIFSPDASNNVISSIECGDNFSGFLTQSGEVFSFGDNSQGQLGIGTNQDCVDAPIKVSLDEQVCQVSMGFRHTLFLTKRNDVFGVGLNQNYQLGLGDGSYKAQEISPQKIDSLSGQGVWKVIAGGFSAAISSQNQILLWGQGGFGVFKTPQKLYMDKVQFTDCKVSKFQSDSTALALDQSGRVYAWGTNQMGQLGHGDTRDRKLPTQVQALKRKKVSNISVGDQFIVLLGKDVSLAEQQQKREKKRLKKQKLGSIEDSSHFQDNSRVDDNNSKAVGNQIYTQIQEQQLNNIYPIKSIHGDSKDLIYNNLQKISARVQTSRQHQSARESTRLTMNNHPSFGFFERAGNQYSGKAAYYEKERLDLERETAPNRSKSNDMVSRKKVADASGYPETNNRFEDIMNPIQHQEQNRSRSYSPLDQNRQEYTPTIQASTQPEARYQEYLHLKDRARLSQDNDSCPASRDCSPAYVQSRIAPSFKDQALDSDTKAKHSSKIVQELDARAEKTQELLKKANEKSTSSLPHAYERERSNDPNNQRQQVDLKNNGPGRVTLVQAYEKFDYDLKLGRQIHDNQSYDTQFEKRNRNIAPSTAQPDQIQGFDRDNLQLQERANALQREVEALRHQKGSLEVQVEQSKRDYDLRLSQICSDQQLTLREKEEIAKKIADERRGREELGIENREMQYELKKMQSNYQELEHKSRDLERRNHNLEQENDELTSKNQTLEQEDAYKTQKINEVEKFNIDFQESISDLKTNFELKVRSLQKENEELKSLSEQKEGRIKHQFQQMHDDESKIKSIEGKIRDNEDYIEKLIFEQNEYKMKAHNAEDSAHSYKIELEKLMNQAESFKMEKENHEQIMRHREQDQRQLETSFHELKNNFENQIRLLTQDKNNMAIQLTDAVAKNQKLIHNLNKKHVENQKYFRTVEEDSLAKAQISGENRRLEEIIRDLQSKNLKLGELLDQNMFNRAETYKSKILETLNKPREQVSNYINKPPQNRAAAKSPDNIASMYTVSQQRTQINQSEAYGSVIAPVQLQKIPLDQMSHQDLERAAQQSIREVKLQLEQRASARREQPLMSGQNVSQKQERAPIPLQDKLKTLEHKSIRNHSPLDSNLEFSKQSLPTSFANPDSANLTEGQLLYKNYLSTNRPPETSKLNDAACATPTSTTLSNHLQSNHVQYSKNDVDHVKKMQKQSDPHSQRSVLSQETQSYSQVEVPNYDEGAVISQMVGNLPHFGKDGNVVKDQNVNQSLNIHFDVNRKSFDYTPKNFPDHPDEAFQIQLKELSVQPLNDQNKQYLHQHISMQQIEERPQEKPQYLQSSQIGDQTQFSNFHHQPSSETTRKASPQQRILEGNVMSPVDFLRQSQDCQKTFEEGDPNNFTMINQPSAPLSPISQSMPNSKSFQQDQRPGIHQGHIDVMQTNSLPGNYENSMKKSFDFNQSQVTEQNHHQDRSRSPIDSQILKIEALLGKSSQKINM